MPDTSMPWPRRDLRLLQEAMEALPPEAYLAGCVICPAYVILQPPIPGAPVYGHTASGDLVALEAIEVALEPWHALVLCQACEARYAQFLREYQP